MAMLSARFHEPSAAQRVVDIFIKDLGATPNLVVMSPEGARPGNSNDMGTHAGDATAMPQVESVRVSIYDNAIEKGVARDALEAAGGVDIRPIQ